MVRLIWHTVIHPIRSPKTNGLGHLGIHDIKVISPTKQISFQGLRLHGPGFPCPIPWGDDVYIKILSKIQWFFPRCTRTIVYRTKHAMRHYDANLPAIFCWACRNFLLKKTVPQKIIVHFGSCQNAASQQIPRRWSEILEPVLLKWTRIWGRFQCFK